MLAQEYSRFAEIVAQCIEVHIRRALPWLKLPAFYLLDAISKNVYEPYARQFSTFVVPLFLETYNQVDPATRSKMEEMLLTWRTGAPTGKELFGVVPQLAIERGVWGGESSNSAHSFYSGNGQIQKTQVLSELEFTLSQKERAVHANPYDTVSQNHINVLHQLRKLVEAGVSQDELQQILNQLRTFSRSAGPPPPPPAPPVVSPSYPIHPPPLPQQHSYPNPSIPPRFPPTRTQPQYPAQHNYSYGFDQPKPETLDHSVASLAPSSSTSAGPSSVGDIASLFSALVKAGVVSSNSNTPIGAGATSKEEENKPLDINLERESMRAYRKMILSQDVKLTSGDITKRRPSVLNLLYDGLPMQCKQCGIRFADTSIGKKKMEDHLDMHFRQNRKANQNIGRGHSRSWFIGAEDWIHDTSTDVKGKGRADGSRPLNAKAAAAAEVAKRDAELRALYVVVPRGDEAKQVSCPICKESFKSEFLEDDEDWVWKNAVMKDDRVYHATCHAEAVASTNSLAARLRTEIASGSRSGTPEVQSLRLTPPKTASTLKAEFRNSQSPSPESSLVGTKRKVEIGSSISSEADGTPPFKKLALMV
jgi:pre-mRNA cleavage complex 2 protein Pcf11